MTNTPFKQLVIEGGAPLLSGSDLRASIVPPEGQETALELMNSGALFRYSGSGEHFSEVTRLEADFSKYVGSKYALAVSSASSALHIALLSAGLRPGDKVLMPAFTFTAVPSSIVHAGGQVVLVESDEDYRIDIDDLRRKYTEDTRFLLLSHMRGHIADLDIIREFCADNNVLLIEDGAHSLGVTWDGVQTGTLGEIGCYSFQSDKIVNGGEGGMLVTDNEEIIVKATIISGCYEKYWTRHFYKSGRFSELQKTLPVYNARMSNLTAAIIRPQLGELEGRIKTCRRNYERLVEILTSSPNLRLPQKLAKEGSVPDTLQFTFKGLTGAQEMRVVEALKLEGIPVSLFGRDPDNARAFWNWEYLGEIPDLPQTKEMLDHSCDLRLPISISEEKIVAIGEIMLQAIDFVINRDKLRSDRVG